MNPRGNRLELTASTDSHPSAASLRPKRNWLLSMGNWGNSELALENASATAGHPVLWREDDHAFDELSGALRRGAEIQVRELVVQRAIRGDAQAQNLAFRSLFAKTRNEAEPSPRHESTATPTPMTREQAGAFISAGLKAAGIETSDITCTSEEAYTKEQWAKWGR